MDHVLAIGRRYPDVLSALLPALSFMHQPEQVCKANFKPGRDFYTAFHPASTPYGLTDSVAGAARNTAGVVQFWTSRRGGPDPAGSDLSAVTSYTSCVVALYGDYLRLLRTLESLNGRSTRQGLYDNPTIEVLVQAIWDLGAGAVHAGLFGTYMMLLVGVAIFALSDGRAFPGVVLLFLAVPFVLIEARQAFVVRSLAYFSSISNWADILNYTLLLIVTVPGLLQFNETRRSLTAVLVVLMGSKLLLYMRAYTTLVRTIIQAVRDIGAFGAIVLLIMVSFALALSILQTGQDDVALVNFFTSDGAFLRAFALMLGDFDIEDYGLLAGVSPSSTAIVLQGLFYTFQFLVTIVLLNLLIGATLSLCAVLRRVPLVPLNSAALSPSPLFSLSQRS